MEPTNNGHDHIFPSPPSLHPSLNNPPSVYQSPDDLAGHQRRQAIDGYGSQMAPAHHQQSQQETTYVPSLVPPGVDPSQVDVRTFYPYQPNEVKHRKRTTRPQLKVLEDVYKYDKKPNASLRKKLADELGMTPRGVQVWFQNRRAKEKNLARKAEQATDGTASLKKPINLKATAAPRSSASTAPESSSPTPVSSNLPKAAERPSSSRPSPGEVATPPPATPSTSSSSPALAASAPHVEDFAQQSDESPFVQSPPSREASVPSGYLSSTPKPSAAEILAQRRPSLPILSITPSASSSSHLPVRTARASIHGGGSSGLLSVSNGQQPHGFDPSMRRRSVDTSIKRLGAHPYAPLARGINDKFHGANPSHMHSLAPAANGEGASRLDSISSTSGRIGLGLRHGSMPQVLTPMDIPSRVQRRGHPMQEYIANGSFPRGDLAPPRPALMHKHSMPAFHEPSRDFRPSPRSMSSGQPGSMPIFTNPNPFAPAHSAGPTPAFSYDTPVSPLAPDAQPPPSPSSASPPPISQSLMHNYGHGMHIPMRIVQPPVPGPLPEPSFSFGDPSSSPSISSSTASSPPSDHSTVVDVGPVRRDSAESVNSVGGLEGDDASQGSSAYMSRFSSFASAGSESSWTSYWSDSADPEAQKPEILEAPEGFDPARRGSIASTYLPELLNGLEVTDAGPAQLQSFMNDGSADQIPHTESRRGSLVQSEQTTYSPHLHDVYGGQNAYLAQDQSGYAPQDHHVPYPSTGQDPYASDHDVYPQLDKGEIQHVEVHQPLEIQPFTQSSSSELAFALHPQGNMQSNGRHRFSLPYSDCAGQGNSHPPSVPEQSTQLDTSSSAEATHYEQEAYEQQAASYGSFVPDQQQTIYQEQQQVYPGQQFTTYFDYGLPTGTPMHANGAVELASMCIPADYVQQYA